MSRVTRGRSAPAGSSPVQRRGRGVAGGCGGAREDGGDHGLGLLSGNHRSASVAAGEESGGQNGQVSPGRISVGQPRLTRSGLEDLLTAADMGKHDYDWLLTPPGTPLVWTLEAREYLLPSSSPRSNLLARSTSTTTASRFYAQQPETKQQETPARSGSASRPSITASYSSSSGRTSILNMSTASVSSSRPSTPANRSSSSSRTRPAAPSSSRPTPSKTRPAAPAASGDKPRPLHGSRPSTPTQRSHIPATSSSNLSSVQPSAPAPARSPSAGRAASAGSRTPGHAFRPSFPGARIRPAPPPPVPPDVPPDAPANSRSTKVPERPASAGRARPGLSLTTYRPSSHSEAAPPAPATASSNRRRPTSPVVARGAGSSPKRRLQSNGHDSGGPPAGSSKPMLRESAVPKTAAKPAAAAADSTGFGRSISKKSIDMALRHMNIRQSMAGVRGASLFPQSIRATASKAIIPTRISDEPRAPVAVNGIHPAEGHHGRDGASDTNGPAGTCEVRVDGRASEPDIYESSRYDAILLREDARSMSWLHSAEGKPDQSPVFELRFETLPEPFVLL